MTTTMETIVAEQQPITAADLSDVANGDFALQEALALARRVRLAEAAPALLEALQSIQCHAAAQADDPSASHRGAWHTVQRIAEKALLATT